MNRSLKAALAATLALIMALTAIPFSALPRFAAKAETEPEWTVRDGYNEHDYTKFVEFLEQTDENGVKNGEKLSSSYDPNDPETWDVSRYCDIQWTEIEGELRLTAISISSWRFDLCGRLDVSDCTELITLFYGPLVVEEDVSPVRARGFSELSVNASGCTALRELTCFLTNLTELDVSGCTALEFLNCSASNLTELNVSDCTALAALYCDDNNLTELDVSNNTALERLHCFYNNLTELDVSNNTALESLVCSDNNLTELDVSKNTALAALDCVGNNLTELDLSNNPNLPYDHILINGNGHIGYSKDYSDYMRIYAYPTSGAIFKGFFDESGAPISEVEWSDAYEAYIYECEGDGNPTGTIIARFSDDEVIPGDVDGDGTVSVLDALITLRIAMQINDGSGMNNGSGDMDGTGDISVVDALMIMRVALGIS